MNGLLIWGALALMTLAGLVAFYGLIRKRNLHVWLPSYLWQRLRRKFTRSSVAGPRHVLFCFVDHFEPEWRRPAFATALARVDTWVKRYPALAARHRDADGRAPIHSFFFPEEEYKPEYLDRLARLCRQGIGEVEVHLHHDHDTSEGFRYKLEDFKRKLTRHHCLARDRHGNGRYAFIHGNWCLDNAKPDGSWCGVNDEIQILEETGCYADFTLPAAPDPAQTRQINSIYYAIDDPHAPKSHDRGIHARVGQGRAGDLMLIQGVLRLNWKRRSRGLMPKIENSDICASNPPTRDRVDLWVDTAVGVIGRPEWIFVKVHTHGACENDFDTLLGNPMHAMHEYLEAKYNDGKNYVLHYVSAREMYNIARAAEDGHRGNPYDYRDYEIMAPSYAERIAPAPIKIA